MMGYFRKKSRMDHGNPYVGDTSLRLGAENSVGSRE